MLTHLSDEDHPLVVVVHACLDLARLSNLKFSETNPDQDTRSSTASPPPLIPSSRTYFRLRRIWAWTSCRDP